MAEHIDLAKKQADRSGYYGTFMSTGESGVHLLRNHVRSSKIKERENKRLKAVEILKQAGWQNNQAKIPLNYFRCSTDVHEKIEEQIGDAGCLELALHELQEHLLNLPGIGALSEDTGQRQGLRSRQRKPLTELWKSLGTEDLNSSPEISAENIALLSRVESHGDEILQDILIAKTHLQQAEAHFGLMKEKDKDNVGFWTDYESSRSAISALKDSFRNRVN
ncbi:hypothetical protein BDV96DRAFT_646858 [Lophiotrema nucula]|uniref:Uncharacterized protein n=1 Tax=Lophiotrema nucula TaxID=690887 RepID=A0A6A5Z7H1_9PLEO|nr:hypothetical protein BDV96DRAFT_646858 [Lophiotrema nucula]